jgi:hypothetical protein
MVARVCLGRWLLCPPLQTPPLESGENRGNKMKKWNPSYPYQYTILVDEEIKKRVELLSHRDGISMSEAFRRIIMKGLSK